MCTVFPASLLERWAVGSRDVSGVRQNSLHTRVLYSPESRLFLDLKKKQLESQFCGFHFADVGSARFDTNLGIPEQLVRALSCHRKWI